VPAATIRIAAAAARTGVTCSTRQSDRDDRALPHDAPAARGTTPPGT
jgi:hypothetical protein